MNRTAGLDGCDIGFLLRFFVNNRQNCGVGRLEGVRKYPDIFEVVGVTAQYEERKRKLAHIPAYQGLDFVSEPVLFEKYKPDAIFIEGYELVVLNIAEEACRFTWINRRETVYIRFESVLNMAKDKKLTVQMAYMYRYNTAVRKCMELYKTGKLDELTGSDTYMCTGHSGEKKWL